MFDKSYPVKTFTLKIESTFAEEKEKVNEKGERVPIPSFCELSRIYLYKGETEDDQALDSMAEDEDVNEEVFGDDQGEDGKKGDENDPNSPSFNPDSTFKKVESGVSRLFNRGLTRQTT